MPDLLTLEMFKTRIARCNSNFKGNRFLHQYFMNEHELGAKGYKKLKYVGFTEKGFDGFVSKDQCLIKNHPFRDAKVIVTCMIPKIHRYSFGQYVAKDEIYLSHFWCSRRHMAWGTATFNPEVLLMQLPDFPVINFSRVEAFEERTEVNVERSTEGYVNVSVKLVSDPIHISQIWNKIMGKSRKWFKSVCYPVLVCYGFGEIEKKGFEPLERKE